MNQPDKQNNKKDSQEAKKSILSFNIDCKGVREAKFKLFMIIIHSIFVLIIL